MTSIKRSSLGRSADLGQFYNARNETLITGYSLFRTAVPSGLVNSRDTSNTKCEYSTDGTWKQKFENMNIQGQLKASVLGGVIEVQGSGKYLTEQKESFKSVSTSMVYEIRTKSENISINNDQLKALVSTETLKLSDATHVVVGIDWGAKSIVTLEYENSENSDKSQIEGSLAGALRKMGQSISGNVAINLDERQQKVRDHSSFKYYGDFFATGVNLPTTIDEAVSLMKDVPNLISQSNSGKGVALEFSLLPISEIEQLLGLESKIDRKLAELNEQSINRVQQELDNFLVEKQRFNDAKKDIDANANLFPDSVLDLWRKKDGSIQESETGFRSTLAKLFVDIRSGAKQPSELESFLQDFQQDSSKNSSGIQQFLTANSKTLSRLQLILDYEQQGIQFLGKQDNLDRFTETKNGDKDVYVLVCGDQIAVNDAANYKLNRQFFMQLRREKAQTGAIFLAYDVELHAVNNNPEESRAAVFYYSKGARVDSDYRKSYSPKDQRVITIQEKPSKTTTGHSRAVLEVIFLPYGRLASCSGDSTVKVWETASGRELFTLSGHTDRVFSIAMLPNGWLASGSGDQTIRLWDLEQKREVKTLTGHTVAIVSLNVLKNGNLVSYSKDDTIKVWNPVSRDNNLLLTITGHGNKGMVMTFGVLSTDFVVACSRDNDSEVESILRVWDPRDGRLVKSLPTGLKEVWPLLVLSNDQVAIGTFHQDAIIKIIDLNDNSKTRTKEKAYDSAVFCLLQLSNDNLVSSGTDGTSSRFIRSIKVWRFSDLSLLQLIKTDHTAVINSLSISPDETMLASGSDDTTIKLWPIITEHAEFN